MIELRKNQELPVKKGVEFFKKKAPPPSLIVCPTAFGKSIVISKIASEIEEKIIVLQPSKELLEQNLHKLKLLGGGASVYSASMKEKEIGHITYATIGSIKNIGDKFKGYRLIVDEADRFPRNADGMFRKFIKVAGITHVLGLTATPFKLQAMGGMYSNYSVLKMLTAKSKHGNFYKEILHVCQIKEMVEEKYWSPIVYETYNFNTKELVYNSTKADYTESSVRQAYENQNIADKIVDKIAKSDRKSILVFVPTVAHAKDLTNKIPGAEVVYGDMDLKERARIIEGFKALSIRVVVNVNVLSIGFDHPGLDMIVSGRATASLSWWYQVVGRGTRISPNKENILIVDFAGNLEKFGRLEELEYVFEGGKWELYGEGEKLLTSIPINEIGEHTKESQKTTLGLKIALQREKERQEREGIIPFGKFKGQKVSETPSWWRNWMLKEFKFEKENEYIKEHILKIKP